MELNQIWSKLDSLMNQSQTVDDFALAYHARNTVGFYLYGDRELFIDDPRKFLMDEDVDVEVIKRFFNERLRNTNPSQNERLLPYLYLIHLPRQYFYLMKAGKVNNYEEFIRVVNPLGYIELLRGISERKTFEGRLRNLFGSLLERSHTNDVFDDLVEICWRENRVNGTELSKKFLTDQGYVVGSTPNKISLGNETREQFFAKYCAHILGYKRYNDGEITLMFQVTPESDVALFSL